MKRLFAAFLAVLMLILCACGGAANESSGGTGNSGNMGSNSGSSNDIPGMPGNAPGNPQPGLSGGNAPAYTGPGYAVMLKVTINPEFTLYLDEAQKIIRAEAVNEDAKTLFTELDVTGQTYADCMTAVLNGACDQGYLKDGGKITIEYEIADPNAMEIAAISTPVAQFQQDKEMELEVSTGLYTEEIAEGQKTAVVNGQTLFIHRLPILDSDNKTVGESTVYFTIEIPANVIGYNKERMKACVKWISQYDDGTVSVSYFENGFVTHRYDMEPDGVIYQVTCDKNGEIVSEKTIYPENYTRQNEDGSTTTMTFYPSGVMKTADTTWPNGDYQHEEFSENGNIKYMHWQTGGNYGETTFREDGTQSKHVYRNADGSYGEYTYFEDGSSFSRMEQHEANGDYYVDTYYPGGQVETSTSNYGTFHYNPDGSYSYYNDGSMEAHFSGGKLTSLTIDGTAYTDPVQLAALGASLFGLGQ